MDALLARFFALAARAGTAAVLGMVLICVPGAAQVPGTDQPRMGGTLRIGVSSEPQTLNPYFLNTGGVRNVAEISLEGLARGAPDGTSLPFLAAEIPTQANGDVSPDGSVVTWKLKPGVMWSDGQPFTSQDVVYTYQMIMDPTNPVTIRNDYTPIHSVVAPDENTVVVTYKQVYAAYRGAFPWILPAHVFNGETSIAQNAFNRAPSVATGPFVFKSWSSGESIEFDRNPNFREPGKPYLDTVIYKLIPSLDAEVQALLAGDIDVAAQLSENYIPQFHTISGATIETAPSNLVERLYLNTSCPSGPQQGDPACPHPVLGDVNVRRAIALSIDKQSLVHELLFDLTRPATSFLPVGPYAVDLGAGQVDPDQARQLLDQSGWIVGLDGIRTRGGARAHLTMASTAGDNFRAQEEQGPMKRRDFVFSVATFALLTGCGLLPVGGGTA